ncbi:MAG: hypothetical protein ACOY90_22815 [Candidatus Zhuqueibacterota bacterium]
MRTILDSELLTLREAQRLLNVNRCEIMEMIETGQLATVETGSNIRIEGRILKILLACSCINLNENEALDHVCECDASDYEIEMISDWT